MVDLADLEDAAAPKFADLLARALPYITPSNASEFYDLMLRHTAQDLAPDRLRAITTAISHTFMTRGNRAVFVAQKFYRRLPYSRPACGPTILDILYFAIDDSPGVLSATLLARLDEFARRAPHKVLTLFAIAFTKGGVSIFADFLIEKSAYFTVPRALNDYLSLLVHLVLREPALAGDFASAVGEVLREALSSDSDETLALAYNGLCHLADLPAPARVAVRVPLLAAHLARAPVQASVVSYLLRCPPRRGALWPLLERLLALARASTRCAYVLLKMAGGAAAAELLAANPQWMTVNLPQLRFTVNLFCHVFAHPALRPRIAEARRELTQFLVSLRGLGENGARADAGVVPIVCTILRRIDIAPELLRALSESSFVRSFFQTARDAGEDIRALVVLKLFADVAAIPELVGLCDLVVEKLRADVKVAKAAAQAGIAMCRYAECKARFRAVKIAEVLLKQRRTTGVFGTFLDAVNG